VNQWEESTDPQKYIFEDIGIASFLICLWEKEFKEFSLSKKQSFVDLGAGNGFLVYLLTMEGYSGQGIDIQKRKVRRNH
jgi:tRNASer (uridine44-2'-O)-methyltransferase